MLRRKSALVVLVIISACVAPAVAAADAPALQPPPLPILVDRTAEAHGYLAPLGACAGQSDPDASPAVQLRAMRCLVYWARRHAGLGALRAAPRLDRAARMRAAEILRCGQFSHTPCGDPFLRVFVAAGYLRGDGTVAENLAWGAGPLGSARTALAAWLASPPHRANLLARGWRDVGVATAKVNSLFGLARVSVWVVQFGRRGR